jgi:hypothetical protein
MPKKYDGSGRHRGEKNALEQGPLFVYFLLAKFVYPELIVV